jgi:hypothetical protein
VRGSALRLSRIQLSNSQRSAAPILCGAGYAVLRFFPPATGGRGSRPPTNAEGMERRMAHQSSVLPHILRCAGACRRSIAAIFVPGAVTSGRGPGRLSANPIRAAFAALRLRRVQPLKAAPPSGSGRRPRASRVRGYEPRARAPHQPAVSRRPFEARRRISGAVSSSWLHRRTSRDDALGRARRNGCCRLNVAEVWILFLCSSP